MIADKKAPPPAKKTPPAATAAAAAAAAAKAKGAAAAKSAGKAPAAAKKGGGGGGATNVAHLMRGMHFKKSLFNVYVACGLSLSSAALFYLLHNRPRRKLYEEFYANYDADAAFARMQEGGYLQSCPPPPPPKKK